MRLRGEQGVTLVEMLVGMTLSLVILGATLLTFESFLRGSETNNRFTQAEDSARSRVDRMVGALRNAGGGAGSAVLRAGDYDMVVNTDHPGFGQPNGTPGTARYCLDATTGRLWFGWIAAPNTIPGSACPSSGWINVRILDSGVQNQARGRPLFAYSSATPASVRSARVDLYVATSGAKATHLQSGVFFRSLMEAAPVIAPEDTPTATCTDNIVTLLVGAGLQTDLNRNPHQLTISVGGVQMATGAGTLTFSLPPGAHLINTRATNVLGKFTDVNTTVTC